MHRAPGFRPTLVLIALTLTALLAACGGAASPTAAPAKPTEAPKPAAATAPATTTAPAATTAPATVAAAATKPAATPAPAGAVGGVRLTIVADGSEARYKAREVLAGQTLPNDAIGVTNGVAGAIALSPTGTVMKDQSKITVDLRNLKSDQSMRDGFLQRSTLNTDQYPNAVFVPSEVKGLPSPLPTSGEATFQILGDLTLRDVTRPATWEVTATFSPEGVTGLATTAFMLADYSIPKPSVPRVASIEDKITLELAFKAARA
jgi:polyisoprenoid-binding protein YceI